MNIKQIEAFLHIAEEKSFTKAAKLLFMTQPAISFQIKALEEQLGVPLFERMEKKIFLTEAGRIIYPEAKKILAAFEAIKVSISELEGLEKGSLTIGASTLPGEYLLPQIIAAFKKVYPGLAISLQIGSTGEIIEKLENRNIDIGVIGASPEESKIEVSKLTADELILIGPKAFPHNVIEVAELKKLPFILREKRSGTRKIIERELEKAGVSIKDLNLQLELGSVRAILTAIEANLGISFISRWAAKESLQLGKVKLIRVKEVEIRRFLFVAINPNKYNSSITKAFHNFLKEEIINLVSE